MHVNLANILGGASLLVCYAIAPSLRAATDQESFAYFETHIRPILVEHCYECHSEDAGKRKGGLWLDRKAGWEIGGDSGAALVPGDPGESLLMHLVRYEDPDLEMPPERKLPDEVIAKLETWVQMGAPDPRTEGADALVREDSIDWEQAREFWSYQPIEKPAAPEVSHQNWASNEIDQFLVAKMEAKGIEPAPEASKAVLLRRAYLTLTGLPPSLEEQEAFLSDDSPEALANLIDRLVDSPAFAERWGRHWLDISRYSDSSGGGRALPLYDAWRFRDYVIESFRKDKPLDQLIREHIAGDLLPSNSAEQRTEQKAGTGFLVLGPHNYENQDKDLLELEIVDEQLDTIGRSFMGMTIGCARCHDHKFDPIPTADYYAMAGIFMSTRSVEHANVSKWHTQPFVASEEDQLRLASLEIETVELKDRVASLKDQLKALGREPSDPGKAIDPEFFEGQVFENARRKGEWTDSSSNHHFVGLGYFFAQTSPRGEAEAIFRIPVELAGNYEVRIAYSTGSNRNAKAPVIVETASATREFTINQQITPEHHGVFTTLDQFSVPANSEITVRVLAKGESGVTIADAVQVLPVSLVSPAQERTQERIRSLEKELRTAEARLKAAENELKGFPKVMAVSEAEEIADTPIRIRGVARNFGQTVPRGYLQIAWTGNGPMPPIAEGDSGRLGLADWIVSPDNPLTARVMANRIWLHLFGEGIVPTPDNFGATGTGPTHPELLDYLASRLIETGWSTKSMIREIMLSNAWSMASEADNPKASMVDPGNELLWKFHRKRLDAETMRDSILLLSGNLDEEAGGPSLPKGFKSEFGYQFTSTKRSVYIPVFRNQLHEIFGAFDFANPNFVMGKRSQSNIPTQALFLMNSPFMHEESTAAAGRLFEETYANNTERLRAAYRRVLCREPNSEEIALTLEYLETEEAASDVLTAWSGLMRSLFSCVDFQYVR